MVDARVAGGKHEVREPPRATPQFPTRISDENRYDAEGPQTYKMKIATGIFILNKNAN